METCPKCGGTGWRIIQKSGLEGAARCECAAATRTKALKEAARIPPNYRDASLENFNIPQDNPITKTALGTVLMQVRAFVREFPASNPPGLMLVGNTGSGKTHLAVAAMKALLDRGHECLFYDYQNLLDRIRSGYDAASGAADREAYRMALDAEVLVLDDLGAHRVTEWVEDTVTAIITYRCNHRKPLITTTNLPDEDVTGRVVNYTTDGGQKVHKTTLAEAIGLRARSRLFEMCRVVKMNIDVDHRVQMSRGKGR